MSFLPLGPAPESFTAKATTAWSKGDALKFSAGGMEPAGDGDTVNGFAVADCALNAYGTVLRGAFRLSGVAAGSTNFAIGDNVYLAASMELDTGSTGDKAVGEVVELDPAAGGLVVFQFDPQETVTKS